MQEALAKRLSEYHSNVDAVKGCFVEVMSTVDGTQLPHAVTAAIIAACEAVKGNKRVATVEGTANTVASHHENDRVATGAPGTAGLNVDAFVTRVVGPAVFLQVLSGSSASSAMYLYPVY